MRVRYEDMALRLSSCEYVNIVDIVFKSKMIGVVKLGDASSFLKN